MNLGGLSPQAMRDRVVATASSTPKLQTFAASTNQVIDPSKGVSPLVNPPAADGDNDPMKMLKKYAPFIIGAIVLYYIISKK